ncbi:hypothetical protein, partial [Salmonella enterica]|uniref:hypothetical protein n=1 Tax=Salmonella enterica TaxID=28901 RepID=UPI001C9006A9
HYTWLDLELKGTKIPTRLYVSNLGGESLILGFPWLQRVTPHFDFRSGAFEFDPNDIQPEKSTIATLRAERLAQLKQRTPTITEVPDEPTLVT